MRMLGFGDSVADCYIDTGIMYPGGNALNAAVFAKMLGADASYIGYMGDDSVGRYILETVSNRIGLEVSRCRLFHGAHGYTYVRHIQGDRIFISSNHGGIAAKHPMTISEEDKNYIKMFDWIHTSCFSFAQGALPDLSESGAFISMDFSDEFDDEMFRKCCPFIDCACISAGKMSEEKIFRISEQLFFLRMPSDGFSHPGKPRRFFKHRRHDFGTVTKYCESVRHDGGRGCFHCSLFIHISWSCQGQL